MPKVCLGICLGMPMHMPTTPLKKNLSCDSIPRPSDYYDSQASKPPRNPQLKIAVPQLPGRPQNSNFKVVDICFLPETHISNLEICVCSWKPTCRSWRFVFSTENQISKLEICVFSSKLKFRSWRLVSSKHKLQYWR